jgi:hypothetical protein
MLLFGGYGRLGVEKQVMIVSIIATSLVIESLDSCS